MLGVGAVMLSHVLLKDTYICKVCSSLFVYPVSMVFIALAQSIRIHSVTSLCFPDFESSGTCKTERNKYKCILCSGEYKSCRVLDL